MTTAHDDRAQGAQRLHMTHDEIPSAGSADVSSGGDAPDGAAHDGPVVREARADTGGRRSWPASVTQTLALLVAVALIAGSAGWRLGRGRSPEFTDADVGFLADMSVHHNSAVTLGFTYLGRGADSGIAHYARDIIATQSGEMTAMAMLLSEAPDRSLADDETSMEWMGHPVAATAMPGMPTADQMRDLTGAVGAEADEQFTRLMIAHHDAGIAMARAVLRQGRHPTVRAMARTMARAQRYEIAEMNRRRAALGMDPVLTGSGVAHAGGHMRHDADAMGAHHTG